MIPSFLYEQHRPTPLETYIRSKDQDPFIGIANRAGANTVLPGQNLVVRAARLAPSEHSACPDSGYGSTGVGPGRSTYDPCAYAGTLRSPGSTDYGADGCTVDMQVEWPRIPNGRTVSSVPDMDGCDSGNAKAFECTIPQHDCKKSFKTNAELKKHLNRYNRPHKCDEPNCTNEKGFGTRNELDRHKKSRHAEKTLTNGGYYHCSQCDSGKKWPRADNFRIHLKSVHKLRDANVNDYLVSERTVDPQYLLGIGGSAITEPSIYGWQFFPDDMGTRIDPPRNGLSNPLIDLTDGVQNSANFYPQSPEVARCLQNMDLGRDVLNQQSFLENSGQYDQINVPMSLAENRNPPSLGGAMLGYEQMLPPTQTSSFSGPSGYADGGVEYATSDSPMAVDVEDIGLQPLPASEVGTDCEALQETCRYAQEQKKPHFQDDTTNKTGPTPDETNADENITGEDSCTGKGEANKDETERDCTVESSRTMTSQTVIDLTEETSQPEDVEMATAVSLPSQPIPDVADVTDMPAAELKALLENLARHEKFNDVLKSLATSAQPTPPTTLPNSPPLEDYKTSRSAKEGAHKCLICENSYTSRASLTKHKKRHERPYGCTVANCSKAFGSKNDWKRHERSQHFKLETWKCQEKAGTTNNDSAADGEASDMSSKSKLCELEFFLCEEFTGHLEKDHGMCEAEKREEKAKCCRSGGKQDQGWIFWCGFCKKTIKAEPLDRANMLQDSLGGPGMKGRKGKAADEGDKRPSKGWKMAEDFDAFLRWRSNHIDAHFAGRGGTDKQNISTWVHADAAGPSNSQDRHANGAAASSSSALHKRGHARAAEGNRGGRPPPKKRKTAVWFCCDCHNLLSSKVDRCTECSHRRCLNCDDE